jgi:hypothetical protein
VTRAQHHAGRARAETSLSYSEGLPPEQSSGAHGVAVIIDLGAGAKAWRVRSRPRTADENGLPHQGELFL